MEELSLVTEPLPAEIMTRFPETRSAVKLMIKSVDDETELGEYLLSGLELYANPDAVRANDFLDLLFSALRKILVQTEHGFLSLSESLLSWPMFQAGNSLLSSAPGFFEAHRLLRDFFQAPDLFRFIHINLSSVVEQLTTPQATLWFLLDETGISLEKDIEKEHLLFGCVPVVNLYDVWADPIHLNHETRDIPISMGQLHHGTRVHDVESVNDVTDPEKPSPLSKLYQASYGVQNNPISWQIIHSRDKDYFQFSDQRPENERTLRVLAVKCQGYDPAAGELSESAMLRPAGKALPCDGRLLKPVTQVKIEGMLSGDSWQLLSALQLNSRSISLEKQQSEDLRKMLGCFIQGQSEVSRKNLYAIENLICQREVSPCRSGPNYFVSQGSHYTLKLDIRKLGSTPAALFLSLLDHVLNFWRPFGNHSRLTVTLNLSEGSTEKVIHFPVRSDG